MGVAALSEAQFAAATDEIVALILRGCGIQEPHELCYDRA